MGLHRRFILFCLFFGLPLLFLYPPFLASDEPAHFYRAYQVSCFQPVSDVRDGEGGGLLPASLPETVDTLFRNVYAKQGFTLKDLSDAPRLPLAARDKTWTAFTNTALYAPLPYLPQAAGLLVGRAVSLPPLSLLYLARLCSLLCWALMGALALRTIPFYQNALFMLLLTPLVFSKAAVVTADVVTVGVCALLVCQILKMAYGRTDPSRRDIWLLLGLAALAGLCKITYAPLAGLALLIPAERLGGRKRFWLVCGGTVLLAVSVNVIWTGFAATHLPLQTSAAADPGVQARYILSQPFPFAKVVLKYT